MIVVYCTNCFTGVRVMGDPEEVERSAGKDSEFYPDKYICPVCDKPAQMAPEFSIDPEVICRLKMRDLTPLEMTSALHGLGMPDEAQCDLTSVREVFATKKIESIQGFTVKGTTRSSIECFKFEDGTRLFMGASPHGAIVFRIARPFSYVEKQDEL